MFLVGASTWSALPYISTRILSSSELAQLRLAQQAGKGLVVRIGGRLIQCEPGAPCSGMTLFGENGFLLGREAFASESELVKTLLHGDGQPENQSARCHAVPRFPWSARGPAAVARVHLRAVEGGADRLLTVREV